MHIFYSTDIQNNTVFLDSEEANHCKNVLRLIVGDRVNVVSGTGTFYECEIISMEKKGVSLHIIASNEHFNKRNFYLHIAIAPTKNIDRIEWFVEKAVEMGIDEISFIQTARTERKHLSIERMQKIAIGAMKQSQKAYLPKINELISFDKFLNTQTSTQNHQLYIAHLVEGQERKSLKDAINSQLSTPNSQLILIGPEGDFSESEVKTALEKGFQPVSLGGSRLRTETAGIAACHTVNLLLNG